jgi:hypothetical protein
VSSAGQAFGPLARASIPHDAYLIERNVAIAPVYLTAATTWQTPIGVGMYRKPFDVRAMGQPPTIRDALLLAVIDSDFVRMGCPADRVIRRTLIDLVRLVGYQANGGRQRQLVMAGLDRLRALRCESALAPGFRLRSVVWGLLDWYGPDPSGRFVEVKLSELHAGLLGGGSRTYIDCHTLRSLIDQDQVAARLWIFLETQHYFPDRDWLARIFSAEPGGQPTPGDVPAIADLLHLHARRRDRVLRRIAIAIEVLGYLDPHYTLTMRPGLGRHMTNLVIRRKKHDRSRRSLAVRYSEGRDLGTSTSSVVYSGGHGTAGNGPVPSSSPSLNTFVSDVFLKSGKWAERSFADALRSTPAGLEYVPLAESVPEGTEEAAGTPPDQADSGGRPI